MSRSDGLELEADDLMQAASAGAIEVDDEASRKAREIQKLTEEWMDLAFALEQLEDVKKEVKAEWDKEKKTKEKRIKAIRNEITAIRTGDDQGGAPTAEAQRAAQVELFDVAQTLTTAAQRGSIS